jgi:hypothetical protein
MHKYPSILGNDFDPTPSAIWMHPVHRTPSRMHTCKESLDHADPEEYLEGLDGVGPKTAKRIVDGLGPFAEMADIREALSGPEEDVVKSLTKLPGIGQAVALRVKRAWDERQGELLCWCPCCARGCAWCAMVTMYSGVCWQCAGRQCSERGSCRCCVNMSVLSCPLPMPCYALLWTCRALVYQVIWPATLHWCPVLWFDALVGPVLRCGACTAH